MSDDPFSSDSLSETISAPHGGDSGGDIVAAPQGFGERFSNSFGAIVMGLILIPLSCWGLFWNEGHAVRVAQALDEGLKIVRSVGTDRVDSTLNGQLVHVAGNTISLRGVADAELGVQAKGLKLIRHVEMYQWQESQSGSGQDRTFTYSRGWNSRDIDSSGFHAKAGHENPPFPAYRSTQFGAADAKIGAYPVGALAVNALGGSENFAISNAGVLIAQRVTGRPTQVNGGVYYVGQNPAQPRIGDVKISYQIVREGPASFVGRQEADGLQVYRAKNGEQFLLAGQGMQSSDDLFRKAKDDNRALTWILRAVGLVVMLIGFSALFAPVNLLASYVPILGSLVSGAIFLVALAATALVGTSVIAVAWFFYRPLLSLALIAVGLAIAFGLRQIRIRKQAQAPGYVMPNARAG